MKPLKYALLLSLACSPSFAVENEPSPIPEATPTSEPDKTLTTGRGEIRKSMKAVSDGIDGALFPNKKKKSKKEAR